MENCQPGLLRLNGDPQAGYSVDKARDARSTLWKLERQAYDVVIADLSLARAGGESLLEEIAVMDPRPEVIVMTATRDTEPEAVAAALRDGASDVLTKPPASGDELFLSVQRGIGRARMRNDNARLRLKLDGLDRTDTLTGLGNLRAFNEALRREAARSRRYGLPLSLILLDVDGLESINETVGYEGGDQLLEKLARSVAASLREEAGIYRYHGGRFAVVLPHTPLAGAAVLAERLVDSIGSNPLRVSSTTLPVTCSAGVATVLSAGARAFCLATRADLALMEAKQGGGNQVHLHGSRSRRSRPSRVEHCA